MIIDPRNPQESDLAFVEPGQTTRHTLVLLSLETNEEIAYFVVKGRSPWPTPFDELQKLDNYFYEESTCPTNYIPIEMIVYEGDSDSHGLFKHEETVWMTREYKYSSDPHDYLCDVFLQLTKGKKDAKS